MLLEEKGKLQTENMELLNQLSCLQDKYSDAIKDIEHSASQIEELTAMSNTYKNEAQEMKIRVGELTAELEDCANNKFAKKGNSMFSEFVDERLRLEKDLLKLKSENDWLRAVVQKKNDENDSLREELVIALESAGGGRAPGGNEAVSFELNHLRNEIAILREKNVERIQNMHSSTDDQIVDGRVNKFASVILESVR
ncbi:hypothetical protein AB6A40_004776 [Gnathostoma spinigerum]|uniref:Uncharacterized protein n=1 Tax=Gnathostoma spinigerum TaxID=75299 RepID=A0ABD6ENE2_9BILA